MRTENRFDPVFDCQQVFKALMNALAQPGKVPGFAFSITGPGSPMRGKNR